MKASALVILRRNVLLNAHKEEHDEWRGKQVPKSLCPAAGLRRRSTMAARALAPPTGCYPRGRDPNETTTCPELFDDLDINSITDETPPYIIGVIGLLPDDVRRRLVNFFTEESISVFHDEL